MRRKLPDTAKELDVTIGVCGKCVRGERGVQVTVGVVWWEAGVLVVTITIGVAPAGYAEMGDAGTVVEVLKGENFLFTNRADGVFPDV